jgi:hypothetical protein
LFYLSVSSTGTAFVVVREAALDKRHKRQDKKIPHKGCSARGGEKDRSSDETRNKLKSGRRRVLECQ